MIPYDILLRAVHNASVGGPNYWAAAVLVVGLVVFVAILYWLLRGQADTINSMREDSKAAREDAKTHTSILVGVVKENTSALITFRQQLDVNTNQLGEVRRAIEKCGN